MCICTAKNTYDIKKHQNKPEIIFSTNNANKMQFNIYISCNILSKYNVRQKSILMFTYLFKLNFNLQ